VAVVVPTCDKVLLLLHPSAGGVVANQTEKQEEEWVQISTSCFKLGQGTLAWFFAPQAAGRPTTSSSPVAPVLG